jgi:hypothetical protein
MNNVFLHSTLLVLLGHVFTQAPYFRISVGEAAVGSLAAYAAALMFIYG